MHAPQAPGLYGLLAEFDNPQSLVNAADAARRKGYKVMEGYSPFPVEGLREALGKPRTLMPILVFCGGLTGCLTAFLLETLTSGGHPREWDAFIPNWFNYRLNIAGRPFFSWQAFVPPMFELTVLFSAFTSLFGMILLNGLPRPHHPLFEVKEFERASSDRLATGSSASRASVPPARTITAPGQVVSVLYTRSTPRMASAAAM